MTQANLTKTAPSTERNSPNLHTHTASVVLCLNDNIPELQVRKVQTSQTRQLTECRDGRLRSAFTHLVTTAPWRKKEEYPTTEWTTFLTTTVWSKTQEQQTTRVTEVRCQRSAGLVHPSIFLLLSATIRHIEFLPGGVGTQTTIVAKQKM